jgi:hypothetical protein
VFSNQTKYIGDVMKRNAPFLKMYITYIQNLKTAHDLIDKLKMQSTKFNKFIENFQVCKNVIALPM